MAVPRRDVAAAAHLLRAADDRVPASGAVVRVPDRPWIGTGTRAGSEASRCWRRPHRPHRSAACCSSRCGVLLVRGVRGPAALGDLALALAIGVCIAAYTLLDQRGVEYASPIVYQELSMIPVAIAFLVYVLARRGGQREGAVGSPRPPPVSRPSAPTSSSSPRCHALPLPPSRPCVRRASSSRRRSPFRSCTSESGRRGWLARSSSCSGSRSSASSQADRTTGAVRERQLGVGSRRGGDAFGDRLEPGAHPPRVRVDVQEHVLARRERLAAARCVSTWNRCSRFSSAPRTCVRTSSGSNASASRRWRM